MPTGVALRDVRQQLFDAAERILLRDGPNALTSRAVTTEADCAKGVLHRHFPDFDGFLAEFVLDRIARLKAQSQALLDRTGTGTVADNLVEALYTVFESVASSVLGLIIVRDDLRARLRRAGVVGIPMLGEATAMLAAYLTAERDQGRIDAGTDPDMLALTLIGAGHMLFVDRQGIWPEAATVHDFVRKVLAGWVR